MAGRYGTGLSSSDAFNSSFTRRPTGSGPVGGGGVMSMSGSLLGDPPPRRQQQLYDPFAEADNERDSGNSFGRSAGGGDGYGGGGGRYGGVTDFGGESHGSSSGAAKVGYAQQEFGTPINRKRETFPGGRGHGQDSSWRTRSRSPPPHHHQDYSHEMMSSGRRRSPSWSDQQSRGYDGNRNQSTGGFKPSPGSQNSGRNMSTVQSMGSMGMSGQGAGQMLMMVPQGQGGGQSGLMGMMPMTSGQNPFVQRQVPMQVILGQLPAFNPNIFDQQLLASAGGPYGNNSQMGGMMNQNLQRQGGGHDRPGSSAYGRDSMAGDRIGRTPSSRQRSSPGSASVGRRSDPSRYNAPNSGAYRAGGGRGSIGSGHASSTLTPRGGRKRVSDRLAEEVDRKKSRPAGQQQHPQRDRVARVSLGQTNNRGNKAGGGHPAQLKRKSDGNKTKNGQTPNQQKGKNTPGKKVAAAKAKLDAVAKTETEETKAGEEKVKVVEEETDKVEGEENIGEVGAEEVKMEDKKKGKADDEKKKSKYDEFPASLLVCKVCQKVMNDGASYESHLNGRAHTSLIKIVEDRFQKRAELLMFESKLAEEEIGIELERQRRAGKSGTGTGSKNKNHCKMCDCTYTVNWGTHKISLGHRILKEFLHPTCRFCDAQFVHRMDWLNHQFSLVHLRRLFELKTEGKDIIEQETANQDELFSLSIEMSSEEHATKFITIRNLDWKIPSADDLKKLLQDENWEVVIPDGEIIIPKEYDENVAIGEDTMITTTGYCCKVCRIYLTQEKEVLPHCQSKSHFGMYVTYMKKLIKLRDTMKKEETAAAAAALAAEAAAAAAAAAAADKEIMAAEDMGNESEQKESAVTEGGEPVNEIVEVDKPETISEVVDLVEGDEEEVADGGEEFVEDGFTVEEEVGGEDEEMETVDSQIDEPASETDEVIAEVAETIVAAQCDTSNEEKVVEVAVMEKEKVAEPNEEEGVKIEEPLKEETEKVEVPIVQAVQVKVDVPEGKAMPPPASPAKSQTQTAVAGAGNRGGIKGRGGPPRGSPQVNRGRGAPPSQNNRGRGSASGVARGRGGTTFRRPVGNSGTVRGRGRGRPY